ncbi:hypothetical protein [Desertivirga brevis]|uniref:hypothetical protein n=1 Tax=Desertivirga brevis TaxID=2810310 RepID=UPI001A96A770|nr:hypothetical protein [Pedobacter sp. SYSU D00873]
MWKQVTSVEWAQKTLDLPFSIFFNPEFLGTLAQTYSATVIYYLYEEHSQLKSATAFFSKSNEIITPAEFYYHPFWVAKPMTEFIYIEILTSIICSLKATYRRITLKLDPSITDIRPFIWNGFKIENKFTYVNLNNHPSGKSVLKDSLRLETREYLFKVEGYDKRSWELNCSFHQSLAFSAQLLRGYEKLFNLWSEHNFLQSCNLYKGNKLIAAALVLIDNKSGKVYRVMLNRVDNEKYAHTYLNYYFLKWCNEHKYSYVDFCGANIRNISLFKSRFGTTLIPYHKVYYDPYYNTIERLAAKLASVIRRIV